MIKQCKKQKDHEHDDGEEKRFTIDEKKEDKLHFGVLKSR